MKSSMLRRRTPGRFFALSAAVFPGAVVLLFMLPVISRISMPTAVGAPQEQRDTESIPETPASSFVASPSELLPIDTKKSRVYIFVDKTGLGHQHAVEGHLKSGTVRLGATENAGQLLFDMKSFDADTDAARRFLGLPGSTDPSTRQQVNANMRNTDILNVNQYPVATFDIKSAVPLEKKSRKGNPLYELSGEFTLRGRKGTIRFEAEVDQKDGVSHIQGRFNILQTQYGITPFRKALGAVGVANQLTITGDLWVSAER